MGNHPFPLGSKASRPSDKTTVVASSCERREPFVDVCQGRVPSLPHSKLLMRNASVTRKSQKIEQWSGETASNGQTTPLDNSTNTGRGVGCDRPSGGQLAAHHCALAGRRAGAATRAAYATSQSALGHPNSGWSAALVLLVAAGLLGVPAP